VSVIAAVDAALLPSPGREAVAQQAVAQAEPVTFSSSEAFSHVRRLAGRIGPRPAGSRAYRRAVRYVEDEFTALGYETRLQRFRLGGGRGFSWNVVALTPGTTTVRLLIGAHLDTVPRSPGGNDNASGVASLLEAARVLAAHPPEGLALVTFGAEEFQPNGKHHIGSAAYVRRMSAAERDAVELMVSVDMVGKVRPFIAARLRGTPAAGARALASAARTSGARAKVRALGDISDHGPFALAGMDAAFLWTGFEPNHHEPTDVVRNVARRSLPRAGGVILQLATDVLAG
jgi:hypothetical protein